MDVLGQRVKAVTLADEVQDWVQAQAMELVPDDEVNVIVGTGDPRRVAKELESKHKLAAATRPDKTQWTQHQKGGGPHRWIPNHQDQSSKGSSDGKKGGKDSNGKGKGKAKKGGKDGKW